MSLDSNTTSYQNGSKNEDLQKYLAGPIGSANDPCMQ